VKDAVRVWQDTKERCVKRIFSVVYFFDSWSLIKTNTAYNQRDTAGGEVV
jgi:hypothetical protein